MTGSPQRYGIFGWPVAHSRSAAMHNAAFSAVGLRALYVPYAVPPTHLGRAIETMSTLGLLGVNLTVPHKESVLGYLDELSPEAERIGAVNTLVVQGGRLAGHNTDASGLQRALREEGLDPKGRHVCILGAGGAARAALVAVADAGAMSVTVLSRRPAQSAQLVEQMTDALPSCTLRAAGLSKAATSDVFAACNLLIQATSATLSDTEQAREFIAGLDLDALGDSAAVVDLVYAPSQSTPLCRAAAARGLVCHDGTGMLVHQAALAFELWTSQPAPLAVMRDALRW